MWSQFPQQQQQYSEGENKEENKHDKAVFRISFWFMKFNQLTKIGVNTILKWMIIINYIITPDHCHRLSQKKTTLKPSALCSTLYWIFLNDSNEGSKLSFL